MTDNPDVSAVPIAVLIASELARIDGYDPSDQHGGLYDLRWSGGPNPEPEGDAWQMDYLPKGERIAAALTASQHSQPAGMDDAVERALIATVCDGEDVRFYLRASCIVPASNGEADEVCTDSLAREVVRTILTAAGLSALVDECERLRTVMIEMDHKTCRAITRAAAEIGRARA